MTQAPELVLRARIPDAACVMFFGYSRNENQRDYAWVKRGSLYPFVDYLHRFQEQAELANCNPCDYQMATDEAFLVEQGFTEKLLADINMASGNTTYDESLLRGVQETTTSNHDLAYQFGYQNLSKRKKDSRACEGCGAELKIPKKMTVPTSGGHFLCKSCAKMSNRNMFCGICKKWNQSESGSWVRCDGCRVWVHAECDEVHINCFKNLGGRTDYFCPPCKVKFNFELSDSEKEQPKLK